PPVYSLPAAEADNASFNLGTGAGGATLATSFLANYAARSAYQVNIHVDIGLGDSSGTLAVSIAPPPPPLTVTLNQAAGQADPTNASLVAFTVVFSAPVSDFTTGDVTLAGSAGATTAAVSGSGTTYTVAVSGMTQAGTVLATVAAGVAHDTNGTPNAASTSTDNSVTYSTTPLLSQNERFVAQVYLDVLQRPVDPTGLAFWSGR